MKKKLASRSAFFNLRVLIGVFVILTGVLFALAGFATFFGMTANSAQAQQKHKIIDLFDKEPAGAAGTPTPTPTASPTPTPTPTATPVSCSWAAGAPLPT